MPITVTFDLSSDGTDNNDRNRIQAVFARLGWEIMGGTSYRYPALGSNNPSEDWFIHVIPALMYLRSLAEARNIPIDKWTIDATCSAGYRQNGVGAEMLASDKIVMYSPSSSSVGEKTSEDRLRKWIKACADDLAS